MKDVEVSDEERRLILGDVEVSDDEQYLIMNGEPPPRTFGQRVYDNTKDLGIAATRGVLDVGTGVANIMDMAVPQALLPRRPLLSNLADAGLDAQAADQWLSDQRSDKSKENEQFKQEQVQGKDFLGQVGGAISAYAQRPGMIPEALIRSAPSMAASIGVASKVAPAARRLAANATEGAILGGNVAETIRREAPENYNEAWKYAIPSALLGTAIGMGAGKIGGDVEAAMASRLARDTAMQSTDGILKRTAKAAVGEGLIEEAPQSFTENTFQNLGTNKPAFQDAGAAVGEGLVVGAASGGALGALIKRRDDPKPEEPSSTEPPADQPPMQALPQKLTPEVTADFDAIRQEMAQREEVERFLQERDAQTAQADALRNPPPAPIEDPQRLLPSRDLQADPIAVGDPLPDFDATRKEMAIRERAARFYAAREAFTQKQQALRSKLNPNAGPISKAITKALDEGSMPAPMAQPTQEKSDVSQNADVPVQAGQALSPLQDAAKQGQVLSPAQGQQEGLLDQPAILPNAPRSLDADLTPDPVQRRPLPALEPRPSLPTRRPMGLLGFIRGSGGVNTREILGISGERTARNGGLPVGVFRNAAPEIDEVARKMHEAGYLTDEDMNSPGDTGGTRRAAELIRQALDGEKVYTQHEVDIAAAMDAEDEYRFSIKEDAKRFGIKVGRRRFESIEQEVFAAQEKEHETLRAQLDEQSQAEYDRLVQDAQSFGVDVDDAMERLAAQYESRPMEEFEEAARAVLKPLIDQRRGEVNARLNEIATEEAASRAVPEDIGAARPGGEVGDQAVDDGRQGAPTGQEEGFRLEGQTNEEILQAEQAQRAAAKPQAEAAPPDEFVLSGSDRDADQAAARGQQELPAMGVSEVGDITLKLNTADGPANLTVNAKQALEMVEARVQALEMVRRCVG